MSITLASQRYTIVAYSGTLDSRRPSGYAPEWAQNFNSFTNGASLEVAGVFSAASRTVADTTTRYGSSGASAKMSIRTGDAGGFGAWGGIHALSKHFVKGNELWVRWRCYWPAEFVFSSSPAMKILRLHTYTAADANAGYVDLYEDIGNETGGGTPLHTLYEGYDSGADTYRSGSMGSIPTGEWVTYELYVKFDNLAVDRGGGGRIRFWVNGVNVQDRTNTRTLSGATDYCSEVYFFTYWNNETPPDNDVYIDDIIIASSDSPPTSTDSGGRVFIGT